MNILVMKFGGTSVGDPEAIQRSADLAGVAYPGLQVVVVVSALAGITDLLSESSHKSASDRDEAARCTDVFLRRHLDLLDRLLLHDDLRARLTEQIHSYAVYLYHSLFHIYRSGYPFNDSLDAVLSLGELSSAAIFTALLEQKQIPVREMDARELICTDDGFTSADVLFPETESRMRQSLLPALSDGQIVVVPGFIGRNADGRTTTLGRGASDYTASLIAAALNADEIWNWTDVDGVSAIDPRIVPEAPVIPALSYEEMAALAAHGGKVLHPDTVKPLREKHIPLRVKNSFHPRLPGTLVYTRENGIEPPLPVIGIEHHPGISDLHILYGHSSSAEVFENLINAGITPCALFLHPEEDCLTVRVTEKEERSAAKTLYTTLFKNTAVVHPEKEISA